MKVLACLIALISALAFTNAATNKVLCYYGSWATYRPGNGKFDVEDIDANKCTHAVYTFIGLNEDGTARILDDWNDVQLGAFRRFVNLKQRNPNLKVLIAMGGWNEGSERYSRVVNNPTLRTRLVNSVYDFVNYWGFDGFDFDWEYPAQRGGQPSDFYAYIYFLRECRAKFGTRLLLTAAVGANPAYIGTSYDVPNMNIYLDYINLMTYDFHGSWDGRTGQNSPLFPSSKDTNRDFNIDAAIQNWIRNGASRQKLFAGLAFYGQTFSLANPNNNGLHAPTWGPGNAGPYSRQAGLLTYMEICSEINRGGWTVNFDSEQKCYYAFKGNQWVGYDTPETIRIKTEYAVQQNLAGVMMWSIDYEDKNNVCGNGVNPLLNAIHSIIRT